MKDFFVGFSVCLFGAIAIVITSEISNVQSRKLDPNANIYTLVNGNKFYGTNEEANRLNQVLREAQK